MSGGSYFRADQRRDSFSACRWLHAVGGADTPRRSASFHFRRGSFMNDPQTPHGHSAPSPGSGNHGASSPSSIGPIQIEALLGYGTVARPPQRPAGPPTRDRKLKHLSEK